MGRGSRGTGRQLLQLQQLAVEAAKLIAEGQASGVADARRKVASRYRITRSVELPGDDDIDSALRTHQRMFQLATQPQALASLRTAAHSAMQALAEFDPRLTGSVLEGTADQHSTVSILLHCDEVEAVIRFLADRGIPSRSGIQRLRGNDKRVVECPTLNFADSNASYRLVIIPLVLQRQPLIPAGEERAMKRATLVEVARLLSQPPTAEAG